jgi:hypothetical protein
MCLLSLVVADTRLYFRALLLPSQRASQQHVFLQPNLASLIREMRIFYAGGKWLKCVHTTRQPEFGLDKSGELYQEPGTDEVADIDSGMNTGNPIIRHAQFAMPAITDKIHYVSKKLQAFNRLISDSGVIRFDFGFDIKTVSNKQNYSTIKATTDAIEQAELNACCQQMNPAQWSATGRGFIVRAYLNEVTFSRSHIAVGRRMYDWLAAHFRLIHSCDVAFQCAQVTTSLDIFLYSNLLKCTMVETVVEELKERLIRMPLEKE